MDNAQAIAAVTEEAATTTEETAATALGIPEMAARIKKICKIWLLQIPTAHVNPYTAGISFLSTISPLIDMQYLSIYNEWHVPFITDG